LAQQKSFAVKESHLKETKLIALLPALLVVVAVRASAQNCDQLQNASSDELVAYLDSTVPSYVNAECVASAVNTLGNQRYVPAIPVLTKLLDFPWPRHAQPKAGDFVPMRGAGGIYPATTALQKIGKAALPGVLQAIKTGANSRTSYEAAVFVWMGIYKNEPAKGIALLKQGADSAKDNTTRQRLGRAAFRAVTRCSPSHKVECRAAAETRY
jgi:hypothetical protein